eukprot:7096441-Alexandrium_andersonii.AAC.1
MIHRCSPLIEPAFSRRTWTCMSARMVWASRATRGAAQNSRDEGPHAPRAPPEGPANVRS